MDDNYMAITLTREECSTLATVLLVAVVSFDLPPESQLRLRDVVEKMSAACEERAMKNAD